MHQTFDFVASEIFMEEENLEGTQHILVVSYYKLLFLVLIYKYNLFDSFQKVSLLFCLCYMF